VTTVELPIPPVEMRALVGGRGVEDYENPTGEAVYPYLPAGAYQAVFDFGSGCGRVARQLMLQSSPPERYVGIDLHLGMTQWCQRNLQPAASGFVFHHHDVFNPGFNPDPDKPRHLPFPVESNDFSLVNAWSVFTHLPQPQTEFYMAEVARILREDGYVHMTAFLFEKSGFPMMQDAQNALYINLDDPTNAVIYDRQWLLGLADSVGLKVTWVQPPSLRGFQWHLVLRHNSASDSAVELPEDLAPTGRQPPPLTSQAPHLIGVEDEPR
jgi:SAM-dependent methyltransferase